MSISAAHLAIMTRVTQMPDAPNVIWPDDTGANPDGTGLEYPRFVMQEAGAKNRRTGSLKGRTDAMPEVLVRVETQEGDFGRANKALVEALEAWFAPGTRFDGMTVIQGPDVRPRLDDSEAHVVPVYISASTHF